LWLHSLKVAQLLRSAACLHTNQSRSYLNHLVLKHTYLDNRSLHILPCVYTHRYILHVKRQKWKVGCHHVTVNNSFFDSNTYKQIHNIVNVGWIRCIHTNRWELQNQQQRTVKYSLHIHLCAININTLSVSCGQQQQWHSRFLTWGLKTSLIITLSFSKLSPWHFCNTHSTDSCLSLSHTFQEIHS